MESLVEYKEMREAIQRVRELIAQYESDSVKVSAKPIERAIFKVVAQELNKALDGDQ